LLEKFKSSLGSELEKKEVQQAYLQRKDNLARMSEVKDLGQVEKKEETMKISAEEMKQVVMSVEGDGISSHTFEDIGRYTIFPDRQFKRMFPG
jgi:hypothetical protein